MGNRKGERADARKALSVVKSGDTVVIGHAAGEPQHLAEALYLRRDEFRNVRTLHMVDMGKSLHTLPEAGESFRHCSMFAGPPTRKALAEGRADFIPTHLSKIPGLFLDGVIEADVTLAQASPPDQFGFMSLGISVDYTAAALKTAKIAVVQVNKNMPRTLGDSFIHVSDVDYIVEYDEPLIELNRAPLSETDKMIGRHCADLVQDGDTLQLGIGSLPDAILLSLKEKNDLGIHSEMFSDGVMDLVEAGVINNTKKTLHPDKLLATFIMGSRKLYDFIDNNPMVHMAPANYVNNPVMIAQNDNMVSINSCVEIDLMGQIGSEMVGPRQISATGGQVDYVRGTGMAKNGRAIIAVASTTKDGKTSKIVPRLSEGAAVTTLRNDVMYVVTEYGSAFLKGKTLRERGRELIRVAHPDFRDGLIEVWESQFKMKFSDI